MVLRHNCIRNILIYIEENINCSFDYVNYDTLSDATGYEVDVIKYHADQLSDGGFIKNDSNSITSLTFKGHEYISAIRDENFWNKLFEALPKDSYISLDAIYIAANKIAVNNLLNKINSK